VRNNTVLWNYLWLLCTYYRHSTSEH